MSQRLFSFLIVVVFFVLAGVYAVVNHILPPLSDIGGNLLTFVTPLVGVFITLNSWFDVLDSKVADGSLPPGSIRPLLTMSDFYVAMVACLAGIFQTAGLKVIDETTQAFIVSSALVLVNVLLRSFTERTPTAKVTKAQVKAYRAMEVADGARPQGLK
jgi:hypothetical protein